MELSKKDRLILYNQYEILKALNSDDDYMLKKYDEAQTILVDGYKHEYGFLLDGFSDDVSEEVSEFVWEVLQMYRTLINSYDNLNSADKKSINTQDLIFKGFDGNDECEYYSYCKFVLEKMGRYAESYGDGKRDFNTHSAVVDNYKSMISKWHSIRSGKYDNLTKDQMIEVIKAFY